MIDRLQAWFAACVAAAVRSLPYAGEYRYSVVSCNFDAQTVDVRALDRGAATEPVPGQPDLTRVPMRTPGIRLDVAPGAEVLIGYAGMDPTRPEVRAYSQTPGAILRAELLGGTVPVALLGMAVQVTIPASSFVIAVVGSATGTLNPAPVIVDGTITEGSTTIAGLA